jgi:uncharacterized protein YjbI with pentapeptide repeats
MRLPLGSITPPGDGVASLLGGGVASFVRTQGRQSHPKTKTAVNGWSSPWRRTGVKKEKCQLFAELPCSVAQLREAQLCGAFTSYVGLSYVRLCLAQLREAQLCETSTSYVGLSYVKLCLAQLCEAQLCETSTS